MGQAPTTNHFIGVAINIFEQGTPPLAVPTPPTSPSRRPPGDAERRAPTDLIGKSQPMDVLPAFIDRFPGLGRPMPEGRVSSWPMLEGLFRPWVRNFGVVAGSRSARNILYPWMPWWYPLPATPQPIRPNAPAHHTPLCMTGRKLRRLPKFERGDAVFTAPVLALSNGHVRLLSTYLTTRRG